MLSKTKGSTDREPPYVYLVWDTTYGKRVLLAVASTVEEADRLAAAHYEPDTQVERVHLY